MSTDFSEEAAFHKKVDESWKEQVERERTTAQGSGRPSGAQSRGREVAQGDFGFFLSTLSMQAMVALGEVPHPGTNGRQEDLEQARYMIDVLGMLQEKTKGNLTQEEATLLEGLLYELRMKYVAKAKR